MRITGLTTAPVELPSVAWMIYPPVADNAASVTVALLVVAAVIPFSCAMLTVIVYEPSSA